MNNLDVELEWLNPYNQTCMPCAIKINNRSSSKAIFDIRNVLEPQTSQKINSLNYQSSFIVPGSGKIEVPLLLPFVPKLVILSEQLSGKLDARILTLDEFSNSESMLKGRIPAIDFDLKGKSAEKLLYASSFYRISSEVWQKLSESNRKLILDWVWAGGRLICPEELAWDISKKYPASVFFRNSGEQRIPYGRGFLVWGERNLRSPFGNLFLPGYSPDLETMEADRTLIFWGLLIFALIAGPGVICLSRFFKKPWLILALLPLLSLVCSLAILAYSVLQDGVLAGLSSTSLTYLDQSSRKALTVQSQTLRISVLPLFRPLRISPDHFSVALAYDGKLDLCSEKDGSCLISGIGARIPLKIRTAKYGDFSGGIDFLIENGSRKIKNNFSTTIRELYLVEDSDKIWSIGAPVMPGDSLFLNLVNTVPDEMFKPLISEQKTLAPATYLAVLDDDIFASPMVSGLYSRSGLSSFKVIGTYGKISNGNN